MLTNRRITANLVPSSILSFFQAILLTIFRNPALPASAACWRTGEIVCIWGAWGSFGASGGLMIIAWIGSTWGGGGQALVIRGFGNTGRLRWALVGGLFRRGGSNLGTYWGMPWCSTASTYERPGPGFQGRLSSLQLLSRMKFPTG